MESNWLLHPQVTCLLTCEVKEHITIGFLYVI